MPPDPEAGPECPSLGPLFFILFPHYAIKRPPNQVEKIWRHLFDHVTEGTVVDPFISAADCAPCTTSYYYYCVSSPKRFMPEANPAESLPPDPAASAIRDDSVGRMTNYVLQ